MPLVRFESVTKRFAATAAVDDVTLDIFERRIAEAMREETG